MPIVPIVLACFSLFYFADVLLRASEKYFWFDELFTLYLSRLDLHSLWQSLREGADFNPPLIYILTKVSQAFFGEGKIGTRLPEIIAFWILCLSLFRLVGRRAGLAAGSIAMVFPLFTGAFYYAYEARPHALVLACAGLAFVCWQMLEEGRRRRLWLSLFGLSLFLAFMSHCYAVVVAFPFALSQLIKTFRRKQVDFSVWSAIGVPLALAIPIYLPLLRSAHRGLDGTQFNSWFPANWVQVPNYFRFLLGPSLIVLCLALLVISLRRLVGRLSTPAVPVYELLVALGFLLLPSLGVILGKMAGAPFFARYFLSTLLGVCCLLPIAFASEPGNRSNRSGLLFAAVLTCMLAKGFLNVAVHRLHHAGEFLTEPSTGLHLETTPWNPLANESLLTSLNNQPIPIATRSNLLFLPIAHYAPVLARNVYFIADDENDFSIRGLRNWSRWGPRYNRPMTFSELQNSNRDFYLYGGQEVIWDVSNLTSKGWVLRSLRSSGGNNLAWLEHPLKPTH